MILLIIILIILLILSAYFSSTETIFYLSEEKIKKRYIKVNYENFLIFILISNTLVNIFIGIISEKIFSEKIFKDSSIIYSIFLTTSILLFFGEIVPKRLALFLHGKFSSYFLFIMQKWIDFIKFFEKTIDFLIFPIKKIEKEDRIFSVLEIKKVLDDGIKKGYFNSVHASVVSNLISQSFSNIKEHIIHYSDLPDININSDFQKVFDSFKQYNLKNIPVVSLNKKDIFGYISKTDFINQIVEGEINKDNFNIKNIIKPLEMIYEFESIEFCIRRFIETNSTILGVYDEHFQYCGIIDYYKLIDDLLFNISFNYNSKLPIVLNPNISCRSLYYNYNIDFDEVDFDLNLIDLILNKLGKIPQTGDYIFYKDYEISILKMKNKKILLVEISKAKKLAKEN